MSTGMQLMLATILCLITGVGASIFYLKFRSQRAQIGWLDGLLSWISFVLAAFVINLICAPFLVHVGDNPTAAGGVAFALFSSFVLNPLIWLRFRKKQRN